VATVVGSYSFVKYSAAAYSFGFSSTQSYLNDWFWMPLFIFGWLPIIYYSKIKSIPEYFQRRFNKNCRIIVTILLLSYMIGYIGINFYTLGVALNKLLGWDVFTASVIIAAISAVYVTAGGQTSVIMTDLLQAFLLLVAGFVLFGLGIYYLGGFDYFWSGLPAGHKTAFAQFNQPTQFNFIGVFWQDTANTVAFYFLNQGIIMRFLSARSVKDGKKAAIVTVLILMPISAIAVANAGWLGKAMETHNLLPPGTTAQDIFVVVANILCKPGVFGLVMAALTAALMSTADTLINAVAAITVNDVVKPYIKKDGSDKYYLRLARIASIVTAIIGIALVPVYMSFGSIYEAHGTFTAAVTPPMVVALLLGAFWRRYTARAAFWTMAGGMIAIIISVIFPQVMTLFAHGTDMGGDSGANAYKYIRAFWGLLASGAIGVGVTLLAPGPQKGTNSMSGLVWGTVKESMLAYKGRAPNLVPGKKLLLQVEFYSDLTSAEDGAKEETKIAIYLSPQDMDEMAASEGDLGFISNKNLIWGGLRSTHVELKINAQSKPGNVQIPSKLGPVLNVKPGDKAWTEMLF